MCFFSSVCRGHVIACGCVFVLRIFFLSSVPLSISNVRFITRRRQRIWSPLLSTLARALPGSDYPLRLLHGAMAHLTVRVPGSGAEGANQDNTTQWWMALWTAWAHSWLAQLDAELAQRHRLPAASFSLPHAIVVSADDEASAVGIWQLEMTDLATLHTIFVALHGHLSALLQAPSAW